MYITIHCGGMPFNGDTIKTKSLGGSETAAYYLAKEFASKGHSVTMFTNSQDEGFFDGVTYHWSGIVDEHNPFGARFQHWASNNPHDVLIVQRAPHAFANKWASKMNVLWLHDLALHRMAHIAVGPSWNINQVWTVSDFHKQQVEQVYGYNERIMKVVRNGVDYNLYNSDLDRFPMKHKKDKISMVYSSRPERGLEHLVRPDGIMSKLAANGDRYHLYICAYDNVTSQMKPYYDQLNHWANLLPNVTNVGALTKKQLAELQTEVDLYIYPTEFEEVSCITAMEACASGTPFISSFHAALPETCSVMQSKLLPLKDGKADEDAFVEMLNNLTNEDVNEMQYKQDKAKANEPHSWSQSANNAMSFIEGYFNAVTSNKAALSKHLMKNSDIAALEKLINTLPAKDPIFEAVKKEYDDCYAFYRDDSFEEHYKAYYDYEKNRGVNYGPEDLYNSSRFLTVADLISKFDDNVSIADYGCAHGHYTINLAKKFRNKTFIGIDIEASNIEKARAWAADEKLENVFFVHGRAISETGKIRALSNDEQTEYALEQLNKAVHGIIAAEVLEHVKDPKEVINVLDNYLIDGGLLIVTTPFGGWENIGYEEHWPWRAHLYHFERKDLRDMFKGNDNFHITVVPSGHDKYGDILGSYVAIIEKNNKIEVGELYKDNYKFTVQKPRQTLSACLIVKNAEETLLSCLNSIKDTVDEIIIGIDASSSDRTSDIIDSFISSLNIHPVVKIIDIPKVLDIGFDTARNITLDNASGDWILWIDADEKLIHGNNAHKYLHDNNFDSYCIAQHHFAAEPAGIIKTDFPSRIFRRDLNAKFFGRVHEHPEIELNKGLGKAMVLNDVSIVHSGYTTESIRRERFSRNIGLLKRDRKDYSDRKLGKFLWIRDLAQGCMYNAEQNGGVITNEMIASADEGILIFEELLNSETPSKLLIECLPYYSYLTTLKGNTFEMAFKIDAVKFAGSGADTNRAQEVSASFAKVSHAEKLADMILKERLSNYESKYF